eukprot:1193626-Prorocentrum_minimum.AAC.5
MNPTARSLFHHRPVTASSILRTRLRRFLARPPLWIWVLGFLVGPLFLLHQNRTEVDVLPLTKLQSADTKYSVADEKVVTLASALPEEEDELPEEPEFKTDDSTFVEKVAPSPPPGSEASHTPKVTKAIEVISRIKSLSKAPGLPTSHASSVKSSNAAAKLNAERKAERKIPKDTRAEKPRKTAPSRPLPRVAVPVKLPGRKEVKELVHLEAGRMKIARQCDEAGGTGRTEGRNRVV